MKSKSDRVDGTGSLISFQGDFSSFIAGRPSFLRHGTVRLIGGILIAFALGASVDFAKAASATAVSGTYGAHAVTLASGPNFLSVPFHPEPAFGGTISGATANSVDFSGSPGWTANQFGPRDGMPQYILIVRRDASASPGVEGDWWHVTGNTAGTVSVNAASDDLASLLSAGDDLEIRRLTSLKDLFGFGSGCVLNKDSDFDILSTQEDIIRMVEGTRFTDQVFYHDGTLDSEGYYLNGTLAGTGDGSSITINPDQPIMLFRKSGSLPFDLAINGRVHEAAFTHYLAGGANAVGTVYPVGAPISASGLLESGWISDVNFDILVTEEDLIRSVVGASFGDLIFNYAGTDAENGWYVDGSLNDSYAFQPTKGYIFFHKGTGPLIWRQSSPLKP